MLRTVEETAIQLGVSKTTIYNKLKLKEYKSRIVKKQGKSMVDDSLFNLIQESLKVQNEVKNKEIENDVNAEISIDEDGLLNLNKELIDNLLEQLKEKDKQIAELHKLIENSQILLKEEQKKKEEKLPKLTDEGRENMKNIYHSETKRAFLTFDDGPSTNTSTILDILNSQNIKATFFMLGTRVEAMPETVKKVYEQGHYIANHGYSHEYSTIYSSQEAVLEEFNKCNNAVRNAIGEPEYNSHLFRFPGGSNGGKYNDLKQGAKQLLSDNDILSVDWNSLSGDAEKQNPTPEYLMERIKSTSQDKSSLVILMHDAQAKKVTADTLPEIISYLKEQGYEFKSFYDIIK